MKHMNPSTTGNSAAVSFSELRMVLDSPKTQSHMHEMAHWHDELEGIYVLTGSMDFYLDDRKLTLSSGDFLLITSSAVHYSKAHDEKDSLFLRLFIQPSLFSASDSLSSLSGRQRIRIPAAACGEESGKPERSAAPHAQAAGNTAGGIPTGMCRSGAYPSRQAVSPYPSV